MKKKIRKVFICSPLRPVGNTDREKERSLLSNLDLARDACRFAVECGCIPYAPHLFFPHFLDDQDPAERDLGMLMGLAWLADCDELWVIGRRVSEGMREEIEKAKEWKIPVEHFVRERSPEERLLDAILRPQLELKEMTVKEQ